MSDLLSIDAARADEIAAMAIPALIEELTKLDLASRQLVLAAEQGKGDAQRVTAIPVIEAAIAALTPAEPEAPAEEPAAEEPITDPLVYDGQVEMRNADGSGCSWRGESYEPDADGVVTVPIAAAGDLIDHGFAFTTAKA